jgi:hypothetical protein
MSVNGVQFWPGAIRPSFRLTVPPARGERRWLAKLARC